MEACMRILQAGNLGRTMARWSLVAGLFLSSLACTRDAGDQGAPAPNPAPSAQNLAAAPPAAPSLHPSQPGRDGLAVFEQALAHTLDPSRKSTRPVSSGDGVLQQLFRPADQGDLRARAGQQDFGPRSLCRLS